MAIPLGLFSTEISFQLEGVGRCIVPDHLGCGFSDKPKLNQFSYTLETHAQNIRELVDS